MTRRHLLTLALLLLGAPGVHAQGQPQDLKVMTFNIRYAHTTPPNLWEDRRAAVREVMDLIIATSGPRARPLSTGAPIAGCAAGLPLGLAAQPQTEQ